MTEKALLACSAVEGLKLAAQAVDQNVNELSCCAG